MKQLKLTLFLLVLPVLFFFLGTRVSVSAESTPWAQCPSGTRIVRCETFDCPNGDTNTDGVCNLQDRGGRLSDSRNDPFCANPLSGCGEVHYFGEGQNTACSVRVKETETNCNLYKAGTLQVTPNPTGSATPTPRATVTPTPSSSPTTKGGLGVSPSPTATSAATTKGGLPETGPSEVIMFLLVAGGFAGLYVSRRFRLA